MGGFRERRKAVYLPALLQRGRAEGLLWLPMIFYKSIDISVFVSGQSVEHIEEKHSEEPHSDEDVVDSQGDVLLVLFNLDDQRHCVQDEYANEHQPGQDRVVDSIVKEVYAQQGLVEKSVPARP